MARVQRQTPFLTGVIEGFYGQPWSQAERFELFSWMASWGLNTYLYAPKDDLKHRALWRERYLAGEIEQVNELIAACRDRSLRFIYALSPGLDIRYADDSEIDRIQDGFAQLLDLGCEDFALLFDDIPDRVDAASLERWGSLAAAQAHVANRIFAWVHSRAPRGKFFFCPTPYCGRMAEDKLGGENYLAAIGRNLASEIEVFWTGPEIVSREITAGHIQSVAELLGRKPVIWDNLFANDYDGRRFYCGPYAGRPVELRAAVGGILCNPNNEFSLNYAPLRSFAAFVFACEDWDPRASYLSALQEWQPHFETVSGPVTLEDLTLLCDCFYLPHEEGPEAEALYQRAAALLTTDPESWSGAEEVFLRPARRLRELCARLTELRDRRLFYALSRRIWDLREELELLERYVTAVKAKPPLPKAILPETFRGGFIARLQQLLTRQSDGTVQPSWRR
ncbi:MAG: beta-N-acetylglucosaminidase domain-containing protein [Verrucomicrobiota bacterium]